MNYTTEFATTSGWDVKPSWGTGWNARGSFSNGYVWDRIIFTGKNCLYPSRTYTTVVNCVIRHHIDLDMVKPEARTMFSTTANTGYTEGSKNLAACNNSSGTAWMDEEVKDFGIYNIKVSNRSVNATVETAYTPDGLTGIIANPKIIHLSAPYNSAPKVVMTGSLDCVNWWQTPANMSLTDFSMNPCKTGKGPAPAICEQSDVLLDAANAGDPKHMKRVKSGATVQVMKDGRNREAQFNQRVVGDGLTVNSQTTYFTRGGSPWNSGLAKTPGGLNKNLVELRQSAYGPGVLANSTKTHSVSGNDSNIFVKLTEASNPGSSTTLGQTIEWSGVQVVESVAITGVNATGEVFTTPRMISVPVHGTCHQSINIQSVRAVGTAR
ncbi:hypothetical protein [Citricoccus nitrophenolicus]|uniref:hypothetical protein n=1 Tax=Citricoccus nitrophenolicus TaxID=863575 RepID=UPI0031EFB2D4